MALSDSPDDALVRYRESSEESTPLLPGRKEHKISLGGPALFWKGVVTLPILFVVVNLFFHLTRCPLYPSTMDTIRAGWEKEVDHHELLRETWSLEKQDHAMAEEEWKLQEEQHGRDVVRWINEENERKERSRLAWADEYERHLREVERYEEEMAHRMREWNREAEEHRRHCEEMDRRESERREVERRKWQREIEDHDHIVEDMWRREEEERQQLNMFWSQVQAHTCTTYATREYTAQLMNLPLTWEHRVEACKATPLEVHGVSYLAKNCEDHGPGIVTGRWEINQHEPDCATFWNWYKDKGCTSPGSGKRRIEHYLENLPQGGDWREFCATTPVRFSGLEFSGAQECFQRDLGTYGHWEIDDPGCL